MPVRAHTGGPAVLAGGAYADVRLPNVKGLPKMSAGMLVCRGGGGAEGDGER